jgi:hypothetical protein
VAPEAKLAPLIVNVKAAPPAEAELGLSPLIASVDEGKIVNVLAFDVPEICTTDTLTVPAVAMRAAGTVTRICVVLIKAGVSAVFPKCTVAPAEKLVPAMVKSRLAPPATAELGLSPVTVTFGVVVVVK